MKQRLVHSSLPQCSSSSIKAQPPFPFTPETAVVYPPSSTARPSSPVPRSTVPKPSSPCRNQGYISLSSKNTQHARVIVVFLFDDGGDLWVSLSRSDKVSHPFSLVSRPLPSASFGLFPLPTAAADASLPSYLSSLRTSPVSHTRPPQYREQRDILYQVQHAPAPCGIQEQAAIYHVGAMGVRCQGCAGQRTASEPIWSWCLRWRGGWIARSCVHCTAPSTDEQLCIPEASALWMEGSIHPIIATFPHTRTTVSYSSTSPRSQFLVSANLSAPQSNSLLDTPTLRYLSVPSTGSNSREHTSNR